MRRRIGLPFPLFSPIGIPSCCLAGSVRSCLLSQRRSCYVGCQCLLLTPVASMQFFLCRIWYFRRDVEIMCFSPPLRVSCGGAVQSDGCNPPKALTGQSRFFFFFADTLLQLSLVLIFPASVFRLGSSRSHSCCSLLNTAGRAPPSVVCTRLRS